MEKVREKKIIAVCLVEERTRVGRKEGGSFYARKRIGDPSVRAFIRRLIRPSAGSAGVVSAIFAGMPLNPLINSGVP